MKLRYFLFILLTTNVFSTFSQSPIQQFWILNSSCKNIYVAEGKTFTVPSPLFSASNITGPGKVIIPAGTVLQLGCGNASGTTTARLTGSGSLKKIGTGIITISPGEAYSYGAATGGTNLGNGAAATAGSNNNTNKASLGGGGGGSGGTAGVGWRLGSDGGNGFVILAFYDAMNNIMPESYVILKSTSNYTVPANASIVEIWAVGAGGAGGSSHSTSGSNYGGGGGGGGIAYAKVNLNSTTTISVNIGKGGLVNHVTLSEEAGAAGGATTVTFNDIIMTANGGTGGGGGWKNGIIGKGGTATTTGVTLSKTTATGGDGTAPSYASGAGGGSGGGTTTATNISNIQLAASRINGNTYTGQTIIGEGTVVITHPTALGWDKITIDSGATLNKNGYTLFNPITNNGTVNP